MASLPVPKRAAAFIASAVVATSVLGSQPSRGATWTWGGAVSGTWSNASLWSPSGSIPNASTAEAVIDATGANYTVTLASNISLLTLTLSSPNATLTQQSSANLTLGAGTIFLNAGTYRLLARSTITGGTIIGQAGGALVAPLRTSFESNLVNTDVQADVIVQPGGELSAEGTTRFTGRHTITIQGNASSRGLLSGGSAQTLLDSDVVFGSTVTSGFSFGGQMNGNFDIAPTTVIRTGAADGQIGTTLDFVSTNRGIVSSEGAGRVLTFFMSTFNNNNVVRAINGGTIGIDGKFFNAGTLQIGAGSSIVLTNTLNWLPGGTLTNASDSPLLLRGRLNLAAASLQMNSITGDVALGKNGSITDGTLSSADGATLRVVTNNDTGTIDNATIACPVVADSSSRLKFERNWHIDPAGSVIAPAGAQFGLNGTFTGVDFDRIQNLGGETTIGGVCDNAGHDLVLDASRGHVTLGGNGATINGGTISSTGGVHLYADNGSGTLSGVHLSAPLTIGGFVAPPVFLRDNVVLDNAAIEMVNRGGSVSIGRNGASGHGTITFNAPSPGSGTVGFDSSGVGSHEIGPEILIQTGAGSGTVGTKNFIWTNRGTIRGNAGTIFILGNETNLGDMGAINGGAVLFADAATTLDNRSTLSSSGGSLVQFTGSQCANLVAGTLSGDGTWIVRGNSQMLLGGGTITTNASHIILDGANASLPNLNPLQTNSGTLELLTTRDFSTLGDLDDPGRLVLGEASDLNVAGDLTQSATSHLQITLGGTGVEQFSQLAVAADATLAGTLEVTLINGYTPALGDVFTFLTAGSVIGTFDTVLFPSARGGVQSFAISYGADRVSVVAVPEPGALGVLICGIDLLLCGRPRRQRAL